MTAITTALEGQLAHHSALPLRATLGSAMLYHGISKLQPQGLEETSHVFEKLGIKPGRTWALVTGCTEVAAGVLSLLGIGTRVAAVSVLVTQAVAIAKVHGPNGFDSQQGGYEYNLSLMAAALGLLLGGPGALSLHEALQPRGARRTLRRPWRREASPRRELLSLLFT
jgi:putative oxidoreductase